MSAAYAGGALVVRLLFVTVTSDLGTGAVDEFNVQRFAAKAGEGYDGMSSNRVCRNIPHLTLSVRQWIDIMSGVVLVRPPHFLELYRRILVSGYEASDRHFNKLNGCPDEALFAIAEIAALGSWKSEEAQSRLSICELVRRGNEIQRILLRLPVRDYAEAFTEIPTAISFLPACSMIQNIAGPDKATRLTVIEVYRETAVLYLHTVLSGSQPSKFL